MALQTACEASQESRILPLLHPATRDQYAHGGRADHIPRRYAEMDGAELDRRISQAKAALGRRLLILGHHYQRDEIIKYADLRGDSFKLAQQAAARPEADYIVFCGVHFMAESADILSAPHQQVILPNPTAGCSMADMASIAEVEECWETLNEVLGEEAGLVPVTYINSAASLKAFCGEHGGIVCTSSNAFKVMEWAFSRGRRLLFFPDEHLGRNTGHAYGIPEEEMIVWNPKNPQEALDDEARLQRARLILWKGYCSTHMRFSVQQIAKARAEHPDITVIVHPECRREVVEAADLYGSTEYIIQQIEQAPAGSKWAVGTEINLVHRLAQEHPDKLIFCLDPIVCPCSTMYRIHPAYLAWVLEALVEGQVINQVKVAPEVAHWARVALDRMLALK
ncbi:quinolinate synthase NadA [Thermogemmatispora tikiterensis]|uniref:Quinolinate synthase n=1 Tax=Thermogemmatispora tikiterensis TaxID=1825093 RepID=A0A328VA30_9CHLR|nr:quinolinate synthase NadA [Thermogemmatispora tikiterensis]RAQ94418.1 quinolinate synthetase [Thermogemmatispora tikiterensis]